MKKTLIIIFMMALLNACASVPRPTAQASASSVSSVSPPPYDAWASVLEKFVDAEGRVNFSAVAKDRTNLDRFVAYVYDVGPNNHPELFPTKEHVLAYHINAYNALAMHKVIEAGIPNSFGGFKKVSFFAFGKVRVGGEDISLYNYENNIIRPLGDERIHVALNCMVVSCPRLPREPFLADKLDAQLNQESIKFFNEARNAFVDDANKTLIISEILKFYPEDFLAKSPSLLAYVNRYRSIKVPEDYSVKFRDYDWTVNKQPGV
jgi:hypothetical protein